MEFKQFLEAVPPGKDEAVDGVWVEIRDRHGPMPVLNRVRPAFYCVTCQGERVHSLEDSSCVQPTYADMSVTTAVFVCSNCQVHRKVIPFLGPKYATKEPGVKLRKVGEYPPHGGETPSRVLTLLRPHHDLFTKGRRAENQGMGIGAFAYYRQVVEKSKDRLIDEIARVAHKLGADSSVLATFAQARAERQFVKAVGFIKDAIPPSLFIGSQNPLLLLHDALSRDIHSGTDESTLEVASAIRTVLVGLSARMGAALDDEAEMEAAVKSLLARQKDAR